MRCASIHSSPGCAVCSMWGQEEEKEEFARIHYQEKAAHYPGACLTTLLPAP